MLKAVLCYIPGSESGISSASFMARGQHMAEPKQLCIFCFREEKNLNISHFIFYLVALGGAGFDIVDFKTFVVLFLLLGLCFLY